MGILNSKHHHNFPPLYFCVPHDGLSGKKRMKERKGERNICDCSKGTFVPRVSSISMEN